MGSTKEEAVTERKMEMDGRKKWTGGEMDRNRRETDRREKKRNVDEDRRRGE